MMWFKGGATKKETHDFPREGMHDCKKKNVEISIDKMPESRKCMPSKITRALFIVHQS